MKLLFFFKWQCSKWGSWGTVCRWWGWCSIQLSSLTYVEHRQVNDISSSRIPSPFSFNFSTVPIVCDSIKIRRGSFDRIANGFEAPANVIFISFYGFLWLLINVIVNHSHRANIIWWFWTISNAQTPTHTLTNIHTHIKPSINQLCNLIFLSYFPFRECIIHIEWWWYCMWVE